MGGSLERTITMNKTLFDILLPATGKRYDFWIPSDMQMQTAATLVAQAMQVAEPDFYHASPNATLMMMETGEIQNPSITPEAIGLTDGVRFVLI